MCPASLRERSQRDRRCFPRPGQLPGNHGRHRRRPQRRLRPGPAPQHCADRGGRRLELHGRVRRTARRRQPARTPRAVQLRSCARPAPRFGLPPGSARRLAGRRGCLVARQQLAIHSLQPCLDPGRRALVHRRRPPLGLHGGLERSRGRGQRPLLRSQRADLHPLGRAQDLACVGDHSRGSAVGRAGLEECPPWPIGDQRAFIPDSTFRT